MDTIRSEMCEFVLTINTRKLNIYITITFKLYNRECKYHEYEILIFGT